jgi:hypothetical protein
MLHRIQSAIAAAMVLAVGLLAPAAGAREWRRTPDSMARDYALIVDARSTHDLVLVFWFVPQMIPDGPGAEAARRLLQQYVVVGVVHAHTADTGAMTFEDVPAAVMTLQSGEVPARVQGDALPPAAAGLATALQAVFRQSLGNLGQGMRWFYFDGAAVDSCGKGRTTLAVLDENYTYDMPIPGCPAP